MQIIVWFIHILFNLKLIGRNTNNNKVTEKETHWKSNLEPNVNVIRGSKAAGLFKVKTKIFSNRVNTMINKLNIF